MENIDVSKEMDDLDDKVMFEILESMFDIADEGESAASDEVRCEFIK